jgi:signal transduction histidine kinase
MPTHEHAYAQLLSLAVHEFRTPASVVSGYLRMLQRDTEHPLTSRQSKMVDEAEKSCARLVTLVGELSEISNLDGGTARLAQQSVDVFALAQELAGSVQETMDNAVHLEFLGESAGASMTGDIARLRTAFSAIFRAILREKASPCTVVADCRFRQTGDGRSAVIVVADRETVQTAYDSPPGPFDEKRGGLGLALPIARRVIEAHGGRLWSPAGVPDHKGKGTAIIVLPLSGEPA